MSITLRKAGEAGAMKAWVLAKAGNVAEIAQCHVEIPTPGDNEVRVKMVATCINPVDYKRAFFGDLAQFPGIHGSDGSGVVDAVGSAVKTLKVGDRVHYFGNVFKPFGTFAEFSIVDAAACVGIPDGMSFATAGVSPCAAWSAYEALFDRFRIEAGKTIYVAAGAGGVGHYAVQLAAQAGCKVITTASGANVDRMRAEGIASLVIDYKSQNVKEEVMRFTNNVGVDYAFELLGADQTKESLGFVRYKGQYCHIAMGCPELPNNGAFFNGLTMHHVFIPGHHMHPWSMERFVEIGAAVDRLFVEGKLKTDVSAKYSFDQVPQGLNEQLNGHVRGKALVAINDPIEAIEDPKFMPK